MVKSRNDRNLKFTDGKWFIDFTYEGKRIRHFGGFTKEQARNALAKLRIEKLDEKLGFKKPGSRDPIPFEQFAGDFLETYCKQNKKSWKGDELILEALKTHFKGETLQSIGPEMIERYKAKRRAEVSPATVNRGLACLRTMFNKAVDWGRLESNPLRGVKKFKENNARERILSGLEAQRLVENAVPSIRPVLIVALNTGMRRNEILSLKWADIDFAWGLILIADSKSGKPRKIPMNSAVLETLRGLPREAEYIFYNPETKTHIKNISAGFATARKKAKLEGLRLHDLRHTAASKMIEAGVDIVTVSKILGHSSIQMTMRYAHPTPENMRRAVEHLTEILDPTRQKVDTPQKKQIENIPATPSLSNH
jgi:integrase